MKISLNLKPMIFGVLLYIVAIYFISDLLCLAKIISLIKYKSFSPTIFILVGVSAFLVVLYSIIAISKNTELIKITKKNIAISIFVIIPLFTIGLLLKRSFENIKDATLNLDSEAHSALIMGAALQQTLIVFVLLVVLTILYYRSMSRLKKGLIQEEQSIDENYNKLPSMIFGIFLYMIIERILHITLQIFHAILYIANSNKIVTIIILSIISTIALLIVVSILCTTKKTLTISKSRITATPIILAFMFVVTMLLSSLHNTIIGMNNTTTYLDGMRRYFDTFDIIYYIIGAFDIILPCIMAFILYLVLDKTEDKRILKEKPDY